MSFPGFYREVREMVPSVALQTPLARGVARKAGLRVGLGSLVKTAVVSDYVGSAEQPLSRQWLVDLTGLSSGFFFSSASSPIYLFRSDNLSSTTLNPADYEPLRDTLFAQFSSASSEWKEMWPGHLTEQRLTISTSASEIEMNESLLDGAFSVLFQAT